MNIAELCISRYETEDYKSSWYLPLIEDTHYIYNNVKRLLTTDIWKIEDEFPFPISWTENEIVQKVTDYILYNFEDFIEDFNGFYVGDTSLNSVDFGEEEEDLNGLQNYKTDKPYTMTYLKRIFDQEGFTINGDMAYYIVSGGIHLEFTNFPPDKLYKILNN